jgi:hypothetical protein
MIEEKTQVELQLMNDLVLADTSRRDVESKCRQVTDKFVAEKDDLMDRIERQNETSENGEEAESDDEEEKDELKEILSQGREEIQRLEQGNKEECKILEALKQKVALARGQDIVDEIVTSIAEEFKEREEAEGDDDDDDED